MGDKAKDIWLKTKDTVGGLNKTVKIVLVAVLVALLVGLAVWMAVQSNTEYKELFTELTADDMSAVSKYLSDAGVTDVKFQDNNTIMVPAAQADSLKAKVLAAGYPDSGSNYKLYLGNVSALSTESDRSQLNLYQLESSLSGLIRRFEQVQDAVVKLAPGEDRRYVLSPDDTVTASATVQVTTKNNEMLDESTVKSIRNAVAHAMAGLSVDEVAVSDTNGNTYESNGNSFNSTTTSKLKMEMEDYWNKKVQKQVMEVLEPIFGSGNVHVAVNSTFDVSNSTSQSKEFTQPEGSEENAGLINHRESEFGLTPGEGGIGGVPGTTDNADVPNYVENPQLNGDEQQFSGRSEKDYSINEKITQQESSGPTLTDLTVSVTLNSSVPNTTNPDDLVAHVARAAGINAAVQDEKVSIVTHAFYDPNEDIPANVTPIPNPFADLPLWVYLALLAGLFLFMVLFTVFVLLGRRRNRRRYQPLDPVAVEGPELPIVEEPVQMPEPEPAGADIMDVHTERSMELRKSVRELAESSPEIAAQAIKALLRGDDEDNG
ncbi:flagellar basal-body MS-ring/collar protein FliF [Acutalibacter intestini]|uniref:flagellar basal-body MS-ring/collar protein FliF n=1 Tax=Acutalibacter intestini TaxID=3093659 RepID=UPI002AC8B06E|nr:flagellar basal-body MS-ring/collar protein FliF [Acutalibacter sp. M00204]